MKVAFTDRARQDLRAVALFIARDSPTRAKSFSSELRARAAQIAANPLAFPLLRDFEDRGVRRRVFRSYLILYRVESEQILILRILHGARDLESVV